MSEFRTQKEDIIEFLRKRDPLEVNRFPTVDAICLRYPGLSRVDAVDLVLDLVAKGKLERRNGDWWPVSKP
jgi:hypothetical protein